MRASVLAVTAALGASAALAACAEDYMYGPSGSYADVEFSAFYDGHYGPFYGGYWGPGGYFYYSDRDGRRYHRDTERHFRRDGAQGFHPIQGRAPPAWVRARPRDGQGHHP